MTSLEGLLSGEATAPINVAKEAGKARDEGKEYEVHDGDVILFKFNT